MRLRPGSVLEISIDGEGACIQFVGRHSEYGDVIKVPCGDCRSRQPVDAPGYFVFYPVRRALKEGIARIVGWEEPPPIPTKWRRRGVIVGGRVTAWVIEEPTGERVTEALTQEEAMLPIATIWNHAMLVDRIKERWSPTDER